MLTVQEVQKALPAQIKSTVSQEMVDALNHLSEDPVIAETMRENFISYTNVMREGKFKLDDYVMAVKYVSYKVMGYSNRESYIRTFPKRYQRLVSEGRSDKDIASYVAAYNKNKLVNLVYEQTLIPVWILNQAHYQEAINTQVDLMQNAKSEKVRSDAANSILTHLKKPETKQVDLNIGIKDDAGMNELRDQLKKMASMQQTLIEKGVPTNDIAKQKLIEDADYKDVTPDE